ncbi:uncharacterized protein BX664DRAFT_144337 [Halteromyces radiatus]|uniref:uncharacterized protein n=1 Tax=Halteromyces radiatus TaxID=101107 RepID=UPI00221ECA9F|nr:uncharacterized protein BX664DRAFT_144337 [Halteromyces radiatus]KAI8089910.1 hypothetical protein BX664DRAFT_144337 [Halteromyces radiatus]
MLILEMTLLLNWTLYLLITLALTGMTRKKNYKIRILILFLFRQNGVFLGFENGCIFFVPCRDVLNDTAMILQLQFESIAGIHACHLTSTTNVATADYIRAKDTLIVAGSKGTIQIYIKTALEDARQIILFKEFTLPSSVISISFIKGTCSALVFCTNNSLYKVNFTQTITKGPPKKQDVTMDLILLQSPNDIYQLQSVKQHQNILTYQAISKNGNLSSVQVDFDSSPITITRSSDELKKAIENTLTELSQMETNQNILDAYHEQINQQLMLMNKTLYTLQNSNLKKKKNHGSCEDFDLDIQPLVRSAPFTGHQQLFLRVQIRTKLLLNWTSWQLNIDICHQPTLMEESNAQSSGTSEYSLGKSFYIPLDTMENEEDNVGGIIQIWERDIELDARHCILPLNVNTSLTMNMGSLEKLDEDENVPFLEYLPSSSNATNSGITFHVSFTTLDHLHFATPLSSFRLKKLKQSSIKDVTKYMQSKLKESRSGNLYVLNDKIPLDTIYLEHSTVQLRFVTPENNDDLYRSILMTLLSEGKSREDICRIIDNAESAYFTLATHPTYPVAITLSKVPGPIKEDLYVIIQIQCINPLVLVQIEASLLSRLQPYILEEKDDELQKQHTTSSYQIQQQLDDKLASLQTLYRKQYQTGSQTRLMEELQATLDISRQLQNDTWLPIHNFSI